MKSLPKVIKCSCVCWEIKFCERKFHRSIVMCEKNGMIYRQLSWLGTQLGASGLPNGRDDVNGSTLMKDMDEELKPGFEPILFRPMLHIFPH